MGYIGKIIGVLLLVSSGLSAQELSKYIVVDQFGYLPESRKVALIRDPQVGFDADESFTPGSWYCVVNANTGEKLYRAKPLIWKSGKTDQSSGDKAYQLEFTHVTEAGRYYILDEEQNLRSFEFVISPDVYNEVLRQAMRTFYYQRVGCRKEAPYADAGWEDEASHVGDLQDNNCRSWFDKLNSDSEKDVSGGWYDAGDYNKYTNWTANYVVEFMKAYIEKPEAWGDDYNIPESGNGIPDILDEAIWGIDHLLRMQQADGSVLSIVGEAGASPPSSATGASYYGPPNTSATWNTSAAFAIASGVYREIGMLAYADTLLKRAELAYDWGEIYPDSLFYNNSQEHGTKYLGAGQQETDDYGRAMGHLEAACYLFRETGEERFSAYFDAHYKESKLYQYSGFAYPFEALTQEVLLYYTTLENGTTSVKNDILGVYSKAVINGTHNLAAYSGNMDPYLAYMKDYGWGSNRTKSSQGSMNYNLISYGMAGGIEDEARDGAEVYLHYLHGTNPMNMVYLSNMYEYGAENGVNEFYHSWFANGSPHWDRVGVSTYGPAPGFLTGGPNPNYNWDNCCPGSCGSSGNNAHCLDENISPPKGQPDQKSYKDFNNSWPLNSWSVTENSCGYQLAYIRLLSKFVSAGIDCNREIDGSAFIDSCGVCAGGSTGIEPSINPDQCKDQMVIALGDTMFIQGRHLYTADGEKVILRGVNEMFVWSDDKTGTKYLPEIAQTGSNCVRLVWTEEYGNKDQLVKLIDNCIDQHMIAMPECHSATGEWDKLDICINFWNDPALLQGIQANRKWTLLNIGNEVGNGSVTEEQFLSGYKNAIDSLRGWGYTVPLVIDACSWGQDLDMIISTWEEILDYDPLHNILFSVHSYWAGTENYDRLATEAINNGLPIIVGEGPSPTRYPSCAILDYKTGLDILGRNEIGWLSWSWGGLPNGHCIPNFDHTQAGEFGQWTTSYAEQMMAEHQYSLMKTARHPSSFYTDGSVEASGIYLSPEIDVIAEGDSLRMEVLVAPLNAEDRDYSVSIEGDEGIISYDTETGYLKALSEGTILLIVALDENPDIRFSRQINVQFIPVTSISISPSFAVLVEGDTLSFKVEMFPQGASYNSYYFEVSDSAMVIELDPVNERVIALSDGHARVDAHWVGGDVTASLEIDVVNPNSIPQIEELAGIKVFPNPNDGVLYVENEFTEPVELKILDMSGRLMIVKEYKGHIEINTRDLPAGSYMLLHDLRGELLRHKLIIL